MKQTVVHFILVYLKFFAILAQKIHKPVIIGITGSAGKSSARDAVYAILKDYYKTKVIIKGNSETGLPLGILGLSVHSIGFSSPVQSFIDWSKLLLVAPFKIFNLKDTDYLVIEMGIDDPYPPKNMSYLLSITKPDIAIILNIYAVHSAQFEKVVTKPITRTKLIQAIAWEKTKIATKNPECKTVIFNGENEALLEVFNKATAKEIITFGKSTSHAISYKNYKVNEEGTQFTLIGKNTEEIQLNFSGFVLPRIYEETFSAAILAGQSTGLSLSDIEIGLEKNFQLEPGKSTLLKGVNNSLIIDSSYNASKKSVLALIDLGVALKKVTGRPLAFLLGDMREIGIAEKREHEEVAEYLMQNVDYLYCVGPLTKKYVIPHVSSKLIATTWFEDSLKAGQSLKENLPEKCILLVKGSQNTIYLEEAIKSLPQRSKRCTATSPAGAILAKPQRSDLKITIILSISIVGKRGGDTIWMQKVSA
jgi:UDP-N-acetylmuramoyl-tripeptide--D-alanyl-D-alanine ligase